MPVQLKVSPSITTSSVVGTSKKTPSSQFATSAPFRLRRITLETSMLIVRSTAV
jgi:hypothetical protein